MPVAMQNSRAKTGFAFVVSVVTDMTRKGRATNAVSEENRRGDRIRMGTRPYPIQDSVVKENLVANLGYVGSRVTRRSLESDDRAT